MKNTVLILSFLFSFMGFSQDQYIDLDRYVGDWYEIARYQNNFQKKCGATRTNYTATKSGKIVVTNICKKLSNPLKEKVAKGIAIVKDDVNNAKLKVSFVPLLKYFGVFAGDYWILHVGENYEYALVGHSAQKYLWILSRTPELDHSKYEYALDIAQEKGYDLSKIYMSPVWPE